MGKVGHCLIFTEFFNFRPSMLRNRDLNVQKNRDTHALKPGAAKHKSVLNDEKDGPSKPKRAALGDITEVG